MLCDEYVGEADKEGRFERVKMMEEENGELDRWNRMVNKFVSDGLGEWVCNFNDGVVRVDPVGKFKAMEEWGKLG